jgi:hypothetical protein
MVLCHPARLRSAPWPEECLELVERRHPPARPGACSSRARIPDSIASHRAPPTVAMASPPSTDGQHCKRPSGSLNCRKADIQARVSRPRLFPPLQPARPPRRNNAQKLVQGSTSMDYVPLSRTGRRSLPKLGKAGDPERRPRRPAAGPQPRAKAQRAPGRCAHSARAARTGSAVRHGKRPGRQACGSPPKARI